MKKFFTTAFIIAAVAVFADERKDLLKKFKQEYAAAQTEFSEKAETTVELVGAAGECATLSEKHLFEAFDYKLRKTSDASGRLRIIADFHKLSREVQKLHQTPREGMGSLAGMYIYHAQADLMRQQIAVWMLDPVAEKRWKRIAEAALILNGKTIRLDRGKASFQSVMYRNRITLEMLLFPKDVFSCSGRDFAILRTDIPFAANDDYSRVYLCEAKNGRLQVHAALKMPYFSRWELQGRKLIIYGQNSGKEEFSL